MAHRKRRPDPKRPVARPPSLRERAKDAFRLVVRENVRAMLIVAGAATLAQAIIPWTNAATDRVPFIVAGSVMLGISLPGRLWRKGLSSPGVIGIRRKNR